MDMNQTHNPHQSHSHRDCWCFVECHLHGDILADPWPHSLDGATVQMFASTWSTSNTKVGLCLSTLWVHKFKLESAIWANMTCSAPHNAAKPLRGSTSITSFPLNFKVKSKFSPGSQSSGNTFHFSHLDQNWWRKTFPICSKSAQHLCHPLVHPPILWSKRTTLHSTAYLSPCLPSFLTDIADSFCATGAVYFSPHFSQVIIEVRICHPQNERKMNLQSQMQIYLLRKKRRGEGGKRKMSKGKAQRRRAC